MQTGEAMLLSPLSMLKNRAPEEPHPPQPPPPPGEGKLQVPQVSGIGAGHLQGSNQVHLIS